MKQILISLFFLGIAYCDKLNNKYLPPDHAQSSAGSQFIQPPVVADLRTRFNEKSPQKIEQYSPVYNQYSSPNVYSSTSSQYSSLKQYPSPSGQNSGENHYSSSNGPSGQYSSTNGKFFQQNGPDSLPNSPDYGSSGHYPSTKGISSQYSATSGQFSLPNGQNSYPNRQYLSPINQYFESKSNGGFKSQITTPQNQQFKSQNQFQHATRGNNLNSEASSQNYQPTSFGQSSEQPFNTQNQFQHIAKENNLNSEVPSYNYQPTRFGQSSKQLNHAGTSQYGVPNSGNFIQSASNQQSSLQYRSNAKPIAVLRSTSNPNAGDGSYQYSYETENGISSGEEGSSVNDAETARGGYSYTSPEGETIAVEYVADENGFQPKGAHIPQIPEAILKSIELNKAAEARGENQEDQYQASAQDGYQYQGPSGIPQVAKSKQNIPSGNGYGGGSFHENQRLGSNGVPSFGGFGVPQGPRQGFSEGKYFSAIPDNQEGYRY